MAKDEKARAKGQQVKGKIQKEAGRAVGNDRLAAKGGAKETEGQAREAKEKAKDVFKP
ncbi:CsbD family protein [Streptomyces uncialis]|uniref:CsbD family protein n=1 Tax=Streptomyces uncialis TaxID=1048205 RepID=UPI00093C4546|nr:CsbD family protein [Streptomyces uncialis]MCX4658416.1 CsbD family protein [Streptomyces uncialis]WTE14682.1 CsbD family protein [Streptomyces uncialis]